MKKTTSQLLFASFVLFQFQTANAFFCPQSLSKNEKKMVFFDLGETLITAPRKKNNPNAITKTSFVRGAREYLLKLKKMNVKLALISNVPEDWGKTRQDRIERLKQEIQKTWKDKNPFQWALFENRIIVPMDNAHKKPAPDMFVEAKEMAAKMGMQPIFQGDDLKEVEAAQLVGMKAHQVDTKKHDFINSQCFLNSISYIK